MLRLSLAVTGFLLLTAGTAAADRFDDDLLALINDYRAGRELGKLTVKPVLADLAREHSRDMRSRRRMDHAGFERRFRRASATGARSCVENVAWNQETPRQLFDDWKNSPGHDRNMLDPAVTAVGIARSGGYATFFACELPIQSTP